MSNSLDPDQARQNVGPDLGPNCLLRLSTDGPDLDPNCLQRLLTDSKIYQTGRSKVKRILQQLLALDRHMHPVTLKNNKRQAMYIISDKRLDIVLHITVIALGPVTC